MLRALLNWTLALIFLVNTIVNFPVFALDTSINPSTNIEIQENIKKINFSDSLSFYQNVIKSIRKDETFEIVTPYKTTDEFPENLKKIIPITDDTEIDPIEISNDMTTPSLSAELTEIDTNAIEVTSLFPNNNIENIIQIDLNIDTLFFIGYTSLGTGIGAGIGSFFGGVGVVPGALTGGVIGFGGSLVAKAFQEHYIVELIFDITGKVIIIVRPA